jgi:WD40 repeat protein
MFSYLAHGLAGAADHTCRVWNLALAKCALTLGAHDTPITNVWCDDHQILTVASDGRLRVWSNTGTCICVLEGEVNQESRASPPKEIVVFHKPLVFAVLDVNGGVTIWCRDNDGPDASTVPSTGQMLYS